MIDEPPRLSRVEEDRLRLLAEQEQAQTQPYRPDLSGPNPLPPWERPPQDQGLGLDLSGSNPIPPYRPQDMSRPDLSGPNPLPGYQRPMQQGNPMSGWANDPSEGGLGLASRASAQSPGKGLSELRFDQLHPGGDFSKLDALDRWQLWSEHGGQIAQQAAQQREAMNARLQQADEAERQHDLQLLEKIMGSTNPPSVKQKMLEGMTGKMANQGRQLAKAMKDSDYDAFSAYQKYIPDSVQDRFIKGDLPAAELSQWIEQAREEHKVNTKEEVKSQVVRRALDTPETTRTPFQKQIVEEHVAKTELQRAEIELKKAQADKAKSEAKDGPVDHSLINKVHERITGKPWSQGDQNSRLQAEKEYGKLYAEGRNVVMLGTPATAKERSDVIDRQEFLKHDRLQRPIRGSSQAELRTGDYIELNDKQQTEFGDIINSGTTLHALFDMVEPLITATNTSQALKQYGKLSIDAISKRNPQAATYWADSEAFSSRMARVFGSEVGVLTQGDVNRWKAALPTFGDTKQVLQEKKRVFFDIYEQSKSMYKKKVAGEDISKDQEEFRTKTLPRADKLMSATPENLDAHFKNLLGE